MAFQVHSVPMIHSPLVKRLAANCKCNMLSCFSFCYKAMLHCRANHPWFTPWVRGKSQHEQPWVRGQFTAWAAILRILELDNYNLQLRHIWTWWSDGVSPLQRIQAPTNKRRSAIMISRQQEVSHLVLIFFSVSYKIGDIKICQKAHVCHGLKGM